MKRVKFGANRNQYDVVSTRIIIKLIILTTLSVSSNSLKSRPNFTN